MLKKILPLLLLFSIVLPAGAGAQIKIFDEPPFEAYKVSKGDTFWFIGHRYGVDTSELLRLNPDVAPTNMQVGSTIRLKQAETPTESTPEVHRFEAKVAELVNNERAKHGLSPLQHRADISNVAREKAKDMIHSNYFSHNSPNYGSPFDMMRAFGISYRTAGENIAKGQASPQQVMNDWMNSSGHRANILNPDYHSIGVGYYEGAWVQMFIG